MSTDPLLHAPVIGYCLDPSASARAVRQRHWIEYLRSLCNEDAIKWRNKCASMLRRIRRIREAMDKSSVESLSPSMRDNRLQTAIEEYSIQTGLDYEQSKSVLEHGERGGTVSEPEQRLRRFLEAATPPLEETVVAAVSSIGDAAYSEDEKLAEQRSSLFYQFYVWVLSQSMWIVLVSVFLSFLVNEGSYMSAVPVLIVSVLGMAAFPFPNHSVWKMLIIYSLLVIAAKLAWQNAFICDDPDSVWFFSIAVRFTKQGKPYCPPVYLATAPNRLGLYKVGSTTFRDMAFLVWTETLSVVALLIHLRSLFLTGRLGLSPARARDLIGSTDTRPTKDTYTARFLLSLLVTVLLITDWTNISATKPVVATSSILGEGITRNYFSPWQVLAITLFVFQIALDRCLYTLMSHSPSDETVGRPTTARRVVLVLVSAQFALLLVSMNMRVVTPFFAIYALYLVLTAYQLSFDIRPTGGKSGLLWSPGWLSYYAYRAYLLVPFLDELRMICDWVACPATSLSLFMWFKVEDCVQNLRFIQAEMDSRDTLPLLRSDRACIGVSAIVGLIAIITGPLVFFSGLNVLREPNPIVAHVTGLPPTSLSVYLTTTSLRLPLLHTVQVQTEALGLDSMKDDQILAPLMAQRSGDLQRVIFSQSADSVFTLPPPMFDQLRTDLKQTANVTITAEWTFVRSLSSTPAIVTRSLSVPSSSILDILRNSTGGSVRVPGLVPNVLYMDQTAEARIVQEEGFHKNTELTFNKRKDAIEGEWWSITDPSKGVLCLSERTVGSGTSSAGGYSVSVIGLYLGVVLTVGRFIRLSIQGGSKRFSVEELPATATLMTICHGIHIARLFKDIATEKRLYYDLVKVFRDPQLLLAATGPTAITVQNT